MNKVLVKKNFCWKNSIILCLCSLQFSTQKVFIIFKRQWKEYFISYKTHYFRLHEIWTEKIKVVTVCEICNALEAFVGRKSPGEEYFSAPLFCHLPSTCFLFLHLLLSPTKLLSGRPLFKKSKQVSHTQGQYSNISPKNDMHEKTPSHFETKLKEIFHV